MISFVVINNIHLFGYLFCRLILSLVPRPPRGTPQKVVGELYGPVMIVLTLVAILLMGMKDAGHTVVRLGCYVSGQYPHGRFWKSVLVTEGGIYKCTYRLCGF